MYKMIVMAERKKKQLTRKVFLLTKEDLDDLRMIQAYIEAKFGISEEVVAERVARRHYADHIRNKEIS